MTIMQLAGFPAEVVDSVVSVLVPHGVRLRPVERRRVPAAVRVRGGAPLRRRPTASIGFGPTRKAISRIAKEGRKYGVFLGLVTQRPAELDADHHLAVHAPCSPCAWRTSATRRSCARRCRTRPRTCSPSCPRSARARCSPSARAWRCRRGCSFKQLPEHLIPQSQAVINASTDPASRDDRGLHRHHHRPLARRHHEHKQSGLDGGADFESLARDEFSTLSVAPQAPSVPPPPTIRRSAAAAPRLDPDRFRLLKKPLEGRSDVFGAAAEPAAPRWRK